eukprot:TRINITY_DN23228_c0_g4_i1.p1 TRINITY_DN23228_c0_g4~~TRINITY_DN23228_c0_g4_i1.p1  ORF type:complete len:467 (-),score=68.82 TRINITY_DN23228_c0_g4_i1:44-1444(-)
MQLTYSSYLLELAPYVAPVQELVVDAGKRLAVAVVTGAPNWAAPALASGAGAVCSLTLVRRWPRTALVSSASWCIHVYIRNPQPSRLELHNRFAAAAGASRAWVRSSGTALAAWLHFLAPFLDALVGRSRRRRLRVLGAVCSAWALLEVSAALRRRRAGIARAIRRVAFHAAFLPVGAALYRALGALPPGKSHDRMVLAALSTWTPLLFSAVSLKRQEQGIVGVCGPWVAYWSLWPLLQLADAIWVKTTPRLHDVDWRFGALLLVWAQFWDGSRFLLSIPACAARILPRPRLPVLPRAAAVLPLPRREFWLALLSSLRQRVGTAGAPALLAGATALAAATLVARVMRTANTSLRWALLFAAALDSAQLASCAPGADATTREQRGSFSLEARLAKRLAFWTGTVLWLRGATRLPLGLGALLDLWTVPALAAFELGGLQLLRLCLPALLAGSQLQRGARSGARVQQRD